MAYLTVAMRELGYPEEKIDELDSTLQDLMERFTPVEVIEKMRNYNL